MMMALDRRAIGAVVSVAFACAALGCGTSSYVPRADPRISVRLQDGAMLLQRDGGAFILSGWSSDLEKAVATMATNAAQRPSLRSWRESAQIAQASAASPSTTGTAAACDSSDG